MPTFNTCSASRLAGVSDLDLGQTMFWSKGAQGCVNFAYPCHCIKVSPVLFKSLRLAAFTPGYDLTSLKFNIEYLMTLFNVHGVSRASGPTRACNTLQSFVLSVLAIEELFQCPTDTLSLLVHFYSYSKRDCGEIHSNHLLNGEWLSRYQEPRFCYTKMQPAAPYYRFFSDRISEYS